MVNEYKPAFHGLTPKEKTWAGKRFREYSEEYKIDDFSDKQLLENLVFYEAMERSVKQRVEAARKLTTKMNKSGNVKEAEVGEGISEEVQQELEDYLKKILDLKKKLGLFDRSEADEKTNFQIMLNKFKIWKENNQVCRESRCRYCGKMNLHTIRMDVYESRKHPFFKDTYIDNAEAWKVFRAGKITKLELAKILLGQETTLTDYIDWLIDKKSRTRTTKKL